MRILPVFDLLGGQVVRGIAGQRSQYRPVASRLVTDSSPGTVAGAVGRQFGFDQAYVADLDAIAGAPPHFAAYEAIVRQGFTLWIDAGCGTLERAQAIQVWNAQRAAISALIVGLESLERADELPRLLDRVGPQRLVFSLDQNGGRPLCRARGWEEFSPQQIAEQALACGVRRFIALDLSAVGTGQGLITLALCRWLRQRAPAAEITTGGGVRGPVDLQALAEIGCDWALVASALHDGRITPEDAARWG